MSRTKTLLISLAILAAAALAMVLIFFTEPEASKSGATKETAMLVETVQVEKGTFKPLFKATGMVRAARMVQLSPQVSGQLIRQSPQFIPGEIVDRGDLLLQIDPADFRNQLALRKADLLNAEANYKLEKGRQDVARQDYELISDSIALDNPELVLREPQLKSAEAAYQAAKAAVEQAELNLQRASIRSPFKAQVLSRNVNLGSQVSVGDNLGQLAAVDEYWVMVSLPINKSRWLTYSKDSSSKGSMVKIRDKKAWGEKGYREGQLIKLIGALDDQSRMARMIVAVDDPLGMQDSLPGLIINSFVEVEMQGRELENVVRLDRDFLRKNNTIWVMEEGRLSIREPEILLFDEQFAYISKGLNDEERVVSSSLATVAEGAKLRIASDSAQSIKDSSKVEKNHGH